MTINRLRKKKRSSLRKKFVPTMLALALVFSAVMSMGFAKWQDQLTINTNVTVMMKPLQITAIEKNSPYTYSSRSSMFDYLRYGDKHENWFCYYNDYWQFFIVKYRDVVGYAISLGGKTGLGTANASATVYNPDITGPSWNSDDESSIEQTDQFGGVYAFYGKSGEDVRFLDGVHPLGNDILEETDGSDKYGFFTTSGIPLTVTVKNPNANAVTLSGFTSSVSGAASVNISSLSVPANGTATFVITPLRTNGSYKSFAINFADEYNSYSVSINIDSSGTSSVGSAKMAKAPAQTFSMLNNLPSETTTEQTKQTTTTTEEESKATTTTTTLTEAESTTTTTTTGAATTTSAATAEETTTTTAQTTTTPAPTTTTTTAATTATTTTQAPTTTEKPTTRTAAAEEDDENGEAE